MKILIRNGRVIDPATQLRRDLRRRAGGRPRDRPRRRIAEGFSPNRVIDAGGCIVAPAWSTWRRGCASRARARGHARERDGRGGRRRRDQPGLPARHRPGARRAGPGRDAQVPRPEAAPGARVPAGRAHARPGRRGADRDGRAHRGGLRRLQPGRGAAAEHPGAAARAAVRRDLRLHGLAAPAGYLASATASRPAARSPPAWACRACRWPPRRSRCT